LLIVLKTPTLKTIPLHLAYIPVKISAPLAINGVDIAEVVRDIANYGSRQKYKHELAGVNSRLGDSQAALLRVKLKYLDKDIAERRAFIDVYLSGIRHPNILIPEWPDTGSQLFVVRIMRREKLSDYLFNNNIETLIHYPIPPHKQSALSLCHDSVFLVADLMHNQVMSLPMSPVMTESQVDQVVSG
jgi:dTDP-4-amino-4,6-dideoxygalactose transaminase